MSRPHVLTLACLADRPTQLHKYFHDERGRFVGWNCLPDVGMLISLRLHQLVYYSSLVVVVYG